MNEEKNNISTRCMHADDIAHDGLSLVGVGKRGETEGGKGVGCIQVMVLCTGYSVGRGRGRGHVGWMGTKTEDKVSPCIFNSILFFLPCRRGLACEDPSM